MSLIVYIGISIIAILIFAAVMYTAISMVPLAIAGTFLALTLFWLVTRPNQINIPALVGLGSMFAILAIGYLSMLIFEMCDNRRKSK